MIAMLLAPIFGDFDFVSLAAWVAVGILFALFILDERRGGVR